MIDDPCAAHASQLAELALGILTGRERAATLAHVDACPRCAEELEQLSHGADAALMVAPEVEPPVGFEVRLFECMGLPEGAASAGRLRRRGPLRLVADSPRWALAAAAAVVALVVGLSVGWSIGSPANGRGGVPRAAVAELAKATLTENGRSVGHVATYGGSDPWMIVTLADSSAHGRVVCEVVTADGATHKVGGFKADDGYGAWGAPLRVAPQDVRTAEVVSSSGAVIGTARLR